MDICLFIIIQIIKHIYMMIVIANDTTYHLINCICLTLEYDFLLRLHRSFIATSFRYFNLERGQVFRVFQLERPLRNTFFVKDVNPSSVNTCFRTPANRTSGLLRNSLYIRGSKTNKPGP